MSSKTTTHSEVKEPRISVQALAEYMAASERGKRTIAQSCRFRAKMRLIQYNEGKLVAAQFIRKGKVVADDIGAYQAAAIFGFLRASELEPGEEAEKALCRVLDLNAGTVFVAPGDSVNIWNDMKAACASIAERWPNIPKPPGAIL